MPILACRFGTLKLTTFIFICGSVWATADVGVWDGGRAVHLCEPLHPSEHIELSCVFGNATSSNSTGGPIVDCTEPMPVGSLVSYKCKKHYVPLFDEDEWKYEENEITCQDGGHWSKGISKLKSLLCVEDCGHRKINPKPLVINGVRTERISWPWHATLFKQCSQKFANGTKLSVWSYICGGSIIRNSIILTAAHCVTASDGQPEPSQNFKVVLGAQTSDLDLNQLDPTTQVLRVKRIYYIYESYDPNNNYQSDVALLHLEPGMEFNDYVVPVCLPRENLLELDALKPGQTGQVAGFGKQENGSVSMLLKYGELLVKSRTECFKSLVTSLSETQFCAGTLKGDGNWTSVCKGDSGGGLVFPETAREKYYIYGIVSFANPLPDGAPKDSVENCNNNAVFTRVMLFMTWIRTVLETIQGVVLKDLAPHLETPYIQHGPSIGQGHTTSLVVWPQQLDTRLTSVELNNLKFNAEEVLNALERTKVLHTINFTDVELEGGLFKRRVRLPHLKTFVLDLAQGFWEFETGCEGNLLCQQSNIVKSMLYFNKEYDEEWEFKNLVGLGVNIQLTHNIHKLVDINHVDGRVMLNHIAQAEEILDNIPSEDEFQLKHLHISTCQVNFTQIISRAEAGWLGPETLILDNVFWIGGAFGPSVLDLIRKCPLLKELLVDLDSDSLYGVGARHHTLYLTHIPKGLTYFKVSHGIILNASLDEPALPTTTTTPIPSRIVFPDYKKNAQSNSNKATKFQNLTTFFCDNCEIEPGLLAKLHIHFPRLQTLILVTDDKFHSLQQPVSKYLKKFKRLTKFILLEKGRSPPLFRNTSSQPAVTAFRESIAEEEWKFLYLVSPRDLYEADKMSYFYTAWADFSERKRHNPFILRSLQNGEFTFEGDGKMNTRGTVLFPEIPFVLQIELKSLQVSSVSSSSAMVFESLNHASFLTALNLTRIYLTDPFERKVFFYELQSAIIDITKLEHHLMPPSVPSEGYDESHVGMLIPFQMPNLAGVGEVITPKNFTLQYRDRVLLSWRKQQKYLIASQLGFMDDILTDTGKDGSRVIETLVVCNSALTMQEIPAFVKFLYLSQVRMDSDFQSSFHDVRSLVHFRIFSPSTNAARESSEDDKYFIVNLSKLKAPQLQDFGASEVHLAISRNKKLKRRRPARKIPVFTQIHNLFLDIFSLDEVVLTSFWNIFPNVTTLTILLPQDNNEIQPLLPEYERLLLSAILNENLTFLHATFVLSWEDPLLDSKHLHIPASKQISTLLAHFPEVFTMGTETFEFSMSRVQGVWADFKEVTSRESGRDRPQNLRYWQLPMTESGRGRDELIRRYGCHTTEATKKVQE